MFQKFITLLISLLFVFPLASQCELTATASEFECDPFGDSYTFRLTITGGDSLVRFVGLHFELPLPVDEVFTTPTDAGAFVVVLESGSGDSVCQTSFVLAPPEGCEPSTPNCTVSINQEDDACGSPQTLVAEPRGTSPFDYVWSTGDTTATISVLDDVWDYSVSVTDADSCVSVAYVHVFDWGAFNVHVESLGNPCDGDVEPTLKASVFEGEGPYTYAWSSGETTQQISVAIETAYTVTVTDANGCSAIGYGFYHPGVLADQLSISGPTSTNCDGSPIILTVDNPDPNFEYLWINGSDTLQGSSIKITEGGNFDVRGFDPARPTCQSFGWYSVTTATVDPEELRVINFSGDNCADEHSCFGVFATNGSLNFHPDAVSWTLDGVPLTDVNGLFVCVEEFGDYLATIITPCDTLQVGFTFEPVTKCVEICGSVVMDDDQNCDEDGNVIDWSGVIALLVNTRTGITYPAHLNPDGSFCTQVPNDKYIIEVLYDLMTLSTDCETVEPRMTLEEDVTDMQLFARTLVEDAGSIAGETTSLAGPGPEAARLRVYPNPGNGRFTVELPAAIPGTTDLTLYDLTGREVWRSTNTILPYEQTQLFPTGMYVLTAVLSSGERLTQRVVVR